MKWVKLYGTLYKTPCALVVAMNGIFPVFGEIVDILLSRDKVYMRLRLYQTIYFHEHFNAYVVSNTEEHTIISHSDLFSYIPLHSHSVKGLTSFHQKAIILKHHLSSP